MVAIGVLNHVGVCLKVERLNFSGSGILIWLQGGNSSVIVLNTLVIKTRKHSYCFFFKYNCFFQDYYYHLLHAGAHDS